ncbi:MAG TPA: hypothetical protein VFF73_23205 [Planctomycetota bacterium]|nr:hypothetical protein [Planctomycetota bacterium]
MLALRALHLVAIIAWFGSALVDTIVEIAIARAASDEKRRVLMELHRTVDLVLEGPGGVLALISGALLLRSSGWLADAPWPEWLRWKVGCALAAVAINVISVGCVTGRVRALRAGLPTEGWTRAVFATGLGVPFAAVAFWLGLSHTP